ncbi:uncharacterized protein BXZ73DRAFT_103832 [Epithele typhae]|uniref:uncharacterized protein n=1 Tax=Epithele typhae TaxID=378194 RepID=UPI002008CC2B|nr:uncharacterized protein BXZ73DRAFT_103832 [Epithele typhae]KAH9923786.1 hypothetical protein BXZ73DRAFT_103832 [Epithele typhae]
MPPKKLQKQQATESQDGASTASGSGTKKRTPKEPKEPSQAKKVKAEVEVAVAGRMLELSKKPSTSVVATRKTGSIQTDAKLESDSAQQAEADNAFLGFGRVDFCSDEKMLWTSGSMNNRALNAVHVGNIAENLVLEGVLDDDPTRMLIFEIYPEHLDKDVVLAKTADDPANFPLVKLSEQGKNFSHLLLAGNHRLHALLDRQKKDAVILKAQLHRLKELEISVGLTEEGQTTLPQLPDHEPIADLKREIAATEDRIEHMRFWRCKFYHSGKLTDLGRRHLARNITQHIRVQTGWEAFNANVALWEEQLKKLPNKLDHNNQYGPLIRGQVSAKFCLELALWPYLQNDDNLDPKELKKYFKSASEASGVLPNGQFVLELLHRSTSQLSFLASPSNVIAGSSAHIVAMEYVDTFAAFRKATEDVQVTRNGGEEQPYHKIKEHEALHAAREKWVKLSNMSAVGVKTPQRCVFPNELFEEIDEVFVSTLHPFILARHAMGSMQSSGWREGLKNYWRGVTRVGKKYWRRALDRAMMEAEAESEEQTKKKKGKGTGEATRATLAVAALKGVREKIDILHYMQMAGAELALPLPTKTFMTDVFKFAGKIEQCTSLVARTINPTLDYLLFRTVENSHDHFGEIRHWATNCEDHERCECVWQLFLVWFLDHGEQLCALEVMCKAGDLELVRYMSRSSLKTLSEVGLAVLADHGINESHAPLQTVLNRNESFRQTVRNLYAATNTAIHVDASSGSGKGKKKDIARPTLDKVDEPIRRIVADLSISDLPPSLVKLLPPLRTTPKWRHNWSRPSQNDKQTMPMGIAMEMALSWEAIKRFVVLPFYSPLGKEVFSSFARFWATHSTARHRPNHVLVPGKILQTWSWFAFEWEDGLSVQEKATPELQDLVRVLGESVEAYKLNPLLAYFRGALVRQHNLAEGFKAIRELTKCIAFHKDVFLQTDEKNGFVMKPSYLGEVEEQTVAPIIDWLQQAMIWNVNRQSVRQSDYESMWVSPKDRPHEYVAPTILAYPKAADIFAFSSLADYSTRFNREFIEDGDRRKLKVEQYVEDKLRDFDVRAHQKALDAEKAAVVLAAMNAGTSSRMEQEEDVPQFARQDQDVTMKEVSDDATKGGGAEDGGRAAAEAQFRKEAEAKFKYPQDLLGIGMDGENLSYAAFPPAKKEVKRKNKAAHEELMRKQRSPSRRVLPYFGRAPDFDTHLSEMRASFAARDEDVEDEEEEEEENLARIIARADQDSSSEDGSEHSSKVGTTSARGRVAPRVNPPRRDDNMDVVPSAEGSGPSTTSSQTTDGGPTSTSEVEDITISNAGHDADPDAEEVTPKSKKTRVRSGKRLADQVDLNPDGSPKRPQKKKARPSHDGSRAGSEDGQASSGSLSLSGLSASLPEPTQPKPRPKPKPRAKHSISRTEPAPRASSSKSAHRDRGPTASRTSSRVQSKPPSSTRAASQKWPPSAFQDDDDDDDEGSGPAPSVEV